MKCLECGVKTAEATPACVVCGAPAPLQSAAPAWNGSPTRGKRYPVRQRRLRVKRDRTAQASTLAGPGGAEDSAADPVDNDTARWDVPAVIPAGVGQHPPESAQDSEVDGAMLAEWVEASKFSTTRLRPGYDVEEVDAFLDAIRDTFLAREPSLTPDEIRNKHFSTTRLRPGYNEEQVNAFLDEAGSTLAAPVRARCGTPVPSEVEMGCSYCDAFLRDGVPPPLLAVAHAPAGRRTRGKMPTRQAPRRGCRPRHDRDHLPRRRPQLALHRRLTSIHAGVEVDSRGTLRRPLTGSGHLTAPAPGRSGAAPTRS